MISPLVLSRQPCITPGAGHSFGNGFAGSGGGGGGSDVGGGRRLGLGGERLRLGVVEPRAAGRHQHSRAQRQPARAEPRRRNCMPARLRIFPTRLPTTGRPRYGRRVPPRATDRRDPWNTSAKAPLKSPIPQVECTYPDTRDQSSHDAPWQRQDESSAPTTVRPAAAQAWSTPKTTCRRRLRRRLRDHDHSRTTSARGGHRIGRPIPDTARQTPRTVALRRSRPPTATALLSDRPRSTETSTTTGRASTAARHPGPRACCCCGSASVRC